MARCVTDAHLPMGPIYQSTVASAELAPSSDEHRSRREGCRASQGRFPPPLWIRAYAGFKGRGASYQLVRGSRQLGLAGLGFVSLGLPEGLLGVAWPSIRATFGLPLDALGLLLATFATGYFVSSAASGRIIGRFGIGRVLGASCGLTGACLLGYSAAPAWASMVALGALL